MICEDNSRCIQIMCQGVVVLLEFYNSVELGINEFVLINARGFAMYKPSTFNLQPST